MVKSALMSLLNSLVRFQRLNLGSNFKCSIIDDLGKPESPSAPESLETADDSITVMWKSPSFDGGSTITNYIVEYQEKTSKK